jgi:hypothetical protein
MASLERYRVSFSPFERYYDRFLQNSLELQRVARGPGAIVASNGTLEGDERARIAA